MGTAKTFILLAMMTALFVGIGYLIGGATGMIIAFAVAAAMNVFAWWNSDKVVLRMQGAHEVPEDTRNPMLRAFREDVFRLAERAGLPPPRVYIIDTPQPNAFATGRDPAHAAVAATTGLLSALTREEAAGVMAHELAHVQNRDTLTMTVTATLAGAIGMLANFALFFGPRDSEGRSNPVAGLAIMILAARGAEICGNPLWLASALEKIERGARAQINPYAERSPAMAHMYISNPLNGRGPDNFFSTHPSTANRVEALRRLAGEMGVTSIRNAEPAPRRTAGPWG